MGQKYLKVISDLTLLHFYWQNHAIRQGKRRTCLVLQNMGYVHTWTWSYIVILQHQVGSKFFKCTYKSFHYTISIFMNIQFIWVIIGQRLMVNWSGMILNWNLGRGKIFGKVLGDQSRLFVNVSHGHWFTELILHPDCQISNWSNLKIRLGLGKGQNTWHSLTSPRSSSPSMLTDEELFFRSFSSNLKMRPNIWLWSVDFEPWSLNIQIW